MELTVNGSSVFKFPIGSSLVLGVSDFPFSISISAMHDEYTSAFSISQLTLFWLFKIASKDIECFNGLGTFKRLKKDCDSDRGTVVLSSGKTATL